MDEKLNLTLVIKMQQDNEVIRLLVSPRGSSQIIVGGMKDAHMTTLINKFNSSVKDMYNSSYDKELR
ncbi:MAG TPA: hypothetical protein DEB17_10980 [Chlorobaculum sp.]|nr:hypothetical protein [Chlorobaculum sp.]